MEKEILKDLIKFNTINDKENKNMVYYIADFLEKLGFRNHFIEKNGKFNLVSIIGDKVEFGFAGHTDTVGYSKNWSTEPFTLYEKNDFLYGLGVCDMKGSIAAILSVLTEIDLKKLKKGIGIYLTYDEEVGFSGINSLIQEWDIYPNLMIIGEPTNNEIITATKGCIEYEAKVYGKSAHSSMLENGDNAIIKMMDLIKELQNIEFNERNTLYEIPHTTMNIGKIIGGTAVNIVPDLCSLKFDFRTINIDEHYYIEKKLKEIEKSFNCKIEKQLEVYPLVNRNNLTFPSKAINFVTEAGFYPSSEKIILGVGPVNPHEDNEKVSVSSLTKCKEQYKDIIIKYCL